MRRSIALTDEIVGVWIPATQQETAKHKYRGDDTSGTLVLAIRHSLVIVPGAAGLPMRAAVNAESGLLP
jgi:hypothetical protein